MIRIQHLTKVFASGTALRGVDLHVPSGKVCGLIGPNGAGKTTLLRILATVLRPTGGTLEVAGGRLPRDAAEVRPRIGYMPDSFGTYEELRVDAFLAFFAHVYRLPHEEIWTRIESILELVDLLHMRNATISLLSLGARQRLALARVLLHNPEVLLLDEPVSGLDPRARVEMRELLRELGKMGRTVLISSHVLADLAGLCDRLAVLEGGVITFSGTLEELTARVAPQRTVEIGVDGADGREPGQQNAGAGERQGGGRGHAETDRLIAFLRSCPWTLDARPTGAGAVAVSLADSTVPLADISHEVHEAGFRITRFLERQVDLEEAFLRFTEEPRHEHP